MMQSGGFNLRELARARQALLKEETAEAGRKRPPALVRLEEAHETLKRLADLMEEIADDMPHPNRTACMHAAALLSGELPLHHADEDLGLFPVLRKRCLPEDRIDVVLDRLETDHVDDEAALAEIVPTLTGLAWEGELEIDPSSVGYALRGFFEAQRRHIAWEQALVMPLARVRLTADDWQQVAAAMQANRAGPKPDALARRHCSSAGGYEECLRRASTFSIQIYDQDR